MNHVYELARKDHEIVGLLVLEFQVHVNKLVAVVLAHGRYGIRNDEFAHAVGHFLEFANYA